MVDIAPPEVMRGFHEVADYASSPARFRAFHLVDPGVFLHDCTPLVFIWVWRAMALPPLRQASLA